MNPLLKSLDTLLAPEAVESALQTGALVAGVVVVTLVAVETLDLMKKIGLAATSILHAAAENVSAQSEVARAKAARLRPPVAPLVPDQPATVPAAN